MKLKIFTIVFITLSLAGVYSCSSDDNESLINKGDDTAAKITANIVNSTMTKAHDGQWDENDAIGLIMLSHGGTEIVNNVFNYQYYTPSASGDFRPQDQNKTIYLPQDGSRVSFRSYYPYYQNLTTNMIYPVSVTSQSVLPNIDLMTAEHEPGGFSKSDSEVRLVFHHRLSKMIFKLNIQDGQPAFPLKDLVLTMKGMKATGSYDLLNDTLVTNNTIEDIIVPVMSTPAQRDAIVLPRKSGSGVSFHFKAPNGSEYIAKMSDTLSLSAGYKYTFYINLKQTEATVSAVVEPWIEGPTSNYDALQVSTPAGESSGVEPGDKMKVFLEGDNGFAILDTLTYNQDGKWYSNPPIYWQNIPNDPARMRSSIEAHKALNSTQLPDILISDEISVQRNTGADFTLRHAASKVIVQLQSSTFSTQDLANATITLPGFLGGAKEVNGEFIAGQTRGDITVDRTDANNAIAIFQPQAVSPNGTLVRVTINNRNYDAIVGSAGYTFNPGEASKIILKLNQNGVEFSATVVDWVNLPNAYYEVLSVSTPAQASSGVKVGDQMNIYLQDNADFNLLNTFTYNSSGKWYTDNQVYWESIEQDPAVFKASIIAAPALNTSQMSDILIANQISVPRNGAANFTLKHAGSKLIIRLLSTTFSTSDLANATITLPNYLVGGAELKGDFVPGQTRGNIAVDRKDPENSTAIIQPQTVAANGSLVKITISGRDYTVYAGSSAFEYKAGEALAMIITVNKTNASFSANVIDWTDASINLSAVTIGTPVSGATGVLNGEQLEVYIDKGSTRPLAGTYIYNLASNQFTSATPLYWESLDDPTTFYGSILRQAKYNNTQLDDYLIAKPVQVAASNGVTFNLSHPAAKIIVRLTSSDGSFSTTELEQMNLVLPDYATGGTFDSGVFTPGTGRGNVTVEKNVGTGGNSAIAIVQPQTISANTTIITVTNTAGRVYNATLSTPIQFGAGVATVLNVDMKKTLGSMSANVVDWIDGDIINMVPTAIQVTGTLDDSSDFFRNKTVSVYKFGSDFQSLTYSYLQGTNGYSWRGAPIYWDDQQSQVLSVTAVYYPYENLIPSVTSSTTAFTWNLPTVQSQGYDYYDLLTSHLTLTSPQYVNFVFNHPLSKVRVELSSREFTAVELAGAVVRLNGFQMNGSIIMNTGGALASGSRVNVVPNTDTDGSKYSALVMPQKIAANSGVVTITLKGYPNTPFTGTLSSELNFVAGKETVIKVDLKKTEINLSAKLENWTDGETGNIIIQ